MKEQSLMTNTINLVVGDWSDDGHGKTDSYTIQTKTTRLELEKAFKKGQKIIGFNLDEDVCAEYEEYELKESEADKIREHLPNFNIDDLDDGCYMDSESFAILYMEIAKLGDPTIEYEIADNENSINIGGYGLFY
jgi:hypothetical protein